ncbi:hypothetical protein IWW36_001074 [Coemansia brasiliensis]|uniref:F-box domain-containing protein n=1 Tax=Coemansia brasiliensis TaxID=2650707 RepID=A0A9W8ICA9_9FUNG|nr:hypothetical protein IWW36_001074 [Coemansia brasiliensis]
MPVTIAALPYDILYKIFEHAAFMNDFYAHKWKKRLELLAVCSGWRKIALDIVYRHSGVTYGDSEWPFAEVTENTQADEPKFEELETNVDLIGQLGLSHLVKRLDLTIYHFTNPLIVDHMQLLLPNVISLISWTNSNNSLVRKIVGELADRYSEQITHINTNHQLQTWSPREFSKLRYLKINLEHMAACQYSTVLPSTLVSLFLRNIQPSNEWGIFGNDKQYLEFANLKTLDIRYSFLESNEFLETRLGAPKRTLYFPQLENLLLFGNSIDSPVLRHSIFPKKIKYLEIKSYKNVVDTASKVNLPKAEALSMSLNYNQYNKHINILSAINKLAELADNVLATDLNITEPISINSFGNTICTFITNLRVSSLVDDKIAIKLLQACPNAVKLCLYQVKVEGSEDTTKYTIDEHASAIDPIHPSLENATIQFVHTADNNSNAIEFAKYLLIRLSVLNTAIFSGIPTKPLREFRDMYSTAHPHLQAL